MELAEIIEDGVFLGGERRTVLSENEIASVILAVKSSSYDEYVLRCEIAGIKSLCLREMFETRAPF